MGGCCSSDYTGDVLFLRIVEATGIVDGDEKTEVNVFVKVEIKVDDNKELIGKTELENDTPVWNYSKAMYVLTKIVYSFCRYVLTSCHIYFAFLKVVVILL